MKTPGTQRGFTLIELLISIVIGLFLVGGLVTLVQAMKRTTVSQNGLSQLQENERMAMTLMTDVIQSSGYFISPVGSSAGGSFPVTAPFTAAGQYLYGTGGFAAGANTITTRYMTTGSDGVINCVGGINTVSGTTFINKFSVDTVNNNLQCQLTIVGGATTTVPLVNGVTNMQIMYGVQTNTSVNANSIDTYMDATAVSAGPGIGTYWGAVKSVKVTLTFLNPLWGSLPGQSKVNTPQFVRFTRIIAVMSNTGVTST